MACAHAPIPFYQNSATAHFGPKTTHPINPSLRASVARLTARARALVSSAPHPNMSPHGALRQCPAPHPKRPMTVHPCVFWRSSVHVKSGVWGCEATPRHTRLGANGRRLTGRCALAADVGWRRVESGGALRWRGVATSGKLAPLPKGGVEGGERQVLMPVHGSGAVR